jgi:PhzF family phenazine biosynthesis protein
MNIPYYQVNAFIGAGFKGNPAGICLLDYWPEDKVMQEIAAENNLAETAFIVKNSEEFDIRWFTPRVEVDLCGHATLASGFVLLDKHDKARSEIKFNSRSGKLTVKKTNEGFCMNFPADKLNEVEITPFLRDCICMEIVQAFKGSTDYLLILKTEKEIRQVVPNMDILQTLDARGVIISAPGEKVDFVSRFFAPQSGIPEDPVTGSAHTTLIPYWSNRLNKTLMIAWQLSKRGGELKCSNYGERVEIEGKTSLYISGVIHI